jgi:hypothetical protein
MKQLLKDRLKKMEEKQQAQPVAPPPKAEG